MILFQNRQDAGKQLATALNIYSKAPNTLILALPRGGVVVGYEVSEALHLPLDIVCPRKLGAPFNPEFAIGAITETGDAVFSEEYIKEFNITEETLERLIKKEKQEAQSRLSRYRRGKKQRDLMGKRVILIDDGLATGSTMQAAIKTAKVEKAREIILAVPVSPLSTLKRLEKEVDQAIVLATPASFHAISQFYDSFEQTTDQEVTNLLDISFNQN